MISVSQSGLDYLKQHGAKLAWRVFIEFNDTTGYIQKDGGTEKDFTHLVSGIPVIRTSIKPTDRAQEVSHLSLELFNDGSFDVWQELSLVGSLTWHLARVTIKMGPAIGEGEEVVGVFVGELVDLTGDEDSSHVNLTCIDPIARLKRSTSGNASGDHSNKVPTEVARDLLIDAGYEDDLDTATFDAHISEERQSNLELQNYDLDSSEQQTPRWQAINFVLNHTNRGLFWNSLGQLTLFTIAPTLDPPVFTFDRSSNILKLKTQRPSNAIVNKYNIYVQLPDSTEYTNTFPATGQNIFVRNTESIGVFGTLQEDLRFAWTFEAGTDSIDAALNTASVRLDVTSMAPILINIEATIDAFPVELWDYVKVVDSEKNIDINGFVFVKDIDEAKSVCRFSIFKLPISRDDPGDPEYLHTENSQFYDDNVPIWGETSA